MEYSRQNEKWKTAWSFLQSKYSVDHSDVMNDLPKIEMSEGPNTRTQLKQHLKSIKFLFEREYDVYAFNLSEFNVMQTKIEWEAFDKDMRIKYDSLLQTLLRQRLENVDKFKDPIDFTKLMVPANTSSLISICFEAELKCLYHKAQLEIFLSTMITIAVNAFTPDSHVTSLLDEIHELHKQDSELEYIEKILNTKYKDKLKYMILCEDKSNNEINEAVSELEKNLEVSLSNCVYEYQTLLKIIRTITQDSLPLQISDVNEDVTDTDKSIISCRKQLLKLMDVCNKKGLPIKGVDYEVGIEFGYYFKFFIWRNCNKTDPRDPIYEFIYEYMEDDNFATDYINFHICLSTLLKNLTSKSSDWNKVFPFLLQPHKNDNHLLKAYKHKFKLPTEANLGNKFTVDQIDHAFFNLYCFNLKTLIWLSFINNSTNDLMSLVESYVNRLLDDYNGVKVKYLNYYVGFIKLLAPFEDVCSS